MTKSIGQNFRGSGFLFFAIGLLLICGGRGEAAEAGASPNILLIAIDDLRPELNCYGAEYIHSPNIDTFAATGRRFERAYCQQAVCNPSRTSLMTGLRPDTIGVTGNHVHFRSNQPKVVTLSQHFKNHGYHAQSIGKIYHGVFPDGASKTTWDTMGDVESWSVPTTRFGPRFYYTEEGIEQAKEAYVSMYRPENPGEDDWAEKLVFGPMTEAPDVSDETLYDGQVAAKAVEVIGELKRKGEPFFLAVGFIKPHTPFVAPKKYWDLYDADAIELATQKALPKGAPALGGHGSGEIRRYTDQPNRGDIPESNARRMKHGYYACISYTDAQVGKVLGALEAQGLADNTIVVLLSDHGYHLGEHDLWGKTTNFELDTKVALIVRTPGMAKPGEATRALAELVDVYPTLAELAGLPVGDHLEGTSLAGVIAEPNATGDAIAMSQYPRGGNADTGGKTMGYSMRTDRWRYTEWIERVSGLTVARELYDHGNDDGGGLSVEEVNVSEEDRYAKVVAGLSERLRGEVRRDVDAEIKVGEDVTVSATSTSFEACPSGTFTRMPCEIGVWQATAGHAEINNAHQRTGRRSLRIFGGDDHSVELKLNAAAPDGSLTFHAERWTKRTPFRFRVEQSSDGKSWREIFNGDDSVRIGKFSTKVTIAMEGGARHLRFSCSSPANSGLLIDDMSFTSPTPQKVVGVSVQAMQLPVLKGLMQNALLRIRVDIQGTTERVGLDSITVKTGGSIGDQALKSLDLFASGDNPKLTNEAYYYGEKREPTFGEHRFESNYTLRHGANYFWVSGQLNEEADIDKTLRVSCERLVFSNGKTVEPTPQKVEHRLGMAVRNQGQDGVHTSRIPGLVTTKAGTLIGVYDLRRGEGGDLPGNIDVGMSRSTDGGRSWAPMKIIMDMGEDKAWHYDGIGDPAILVDENTGTIWVAATWSHGNRSWVGSGPGLEPEETGQLMLVRSDDDGLTWSEPMNITKQVKDPAWCFLLQGPGKGITMSDGTLVFAAQYQDPPDQKRLPHSTILYSKDHGETWKVGTGAFDDTTESQVVEVEPGVLMLNCRYNRESVRVVMTTRDMGRTWQKHSSSLGALIEPRSCMASLVDVDQERGKDLGGWLLFSNPNSTSGRNHITIKASKDGGVTWPVEYQLLLDEGAGRGYSCLTMIDDETVGILYEGSQAHMTFQRIGLDEIIEPRS